MPRRREVLAVLPALSAVSLVSAQAPKRAGPKRIGDLSLEEGPEKADPGKPLEDEREFWDSLGKKGWILGDNVVIERVYANWRTESLAGLAAELVRKHVDVILCVDESAMVAAARATQSVPILFGGALMPIEQGLIDSFARPGRNLTGTSMHAGTEVATKRLEFLRAIVRGDRLSWLWGGDSRFAETVAGVRLDVAKMYESAAAGLGFATRLHFVPTPGDIDRVFEDIIAWKAQAITGGGFQVFAVQQRVAEFALRNGLPLATNHRSYVQAGGLLSYGPSRSETVLLGQGFMEYLDRILRGAKPSELPVIQPSRYELVINMKTAKTLGLTIPTSVLQRADEILQ
jgi:putative ABC transport system substrate-binding protein